MLHGYSSFLLVFSLVIIIVVYGEVLASEKTRNEATSAVSRACRHTQHKNLCIDSLMAHPAATLAVKEEDMVHVSVNVTLERFGKALYLSSELIDTPMGKHERSAYQACIELLDESVELLSRSLSSVTSSLNGKSQASDDVLAWLSAALTNQDTCTDGLSEVTGSVKNQMQQRLRDLEELASNSLAIFSTSVKDGDFDGIPIQNSRRPQKKQKFPGWLSRRDRHLLDIPVAGVQADIVVSKDGNGTCKTIEEAIKKAPEFSTRRIVIYVKAGNFQIIKWSQVHRGEFEGWQKEDQFNVYWRWQGKDSDFGREKCIRQSNHIPHCVIAATGSGFIARDMTFENTAGPSKHQAVALRVGADHGVVYRCNVIGYQDTLYVHSNRQFFRECDIYGTVDFIFGNAAVVFQNCNIFARKPMDFQKNTITAQNRKYAQQNTGISLHACKIVATSDLEASKGNFLTFLGRPWKLYSRTVVMLSFIGDHVHPRGWLEWNATFALDTLYYGEYLNSGPGSPVGQRVKWPGYHVINSTTEASQFTVGQFIYGSAWLPSTGVSFIGGLSV